MPVQVDGEPKIQPPGDIVVLRSALKVSDPYSLYKVLILCAIIKYFCPI